MRSGIDTGFNAWDRTECNRFADLRRADTPARRAYWRMVRGIADGLEDLQNAEIVVLWRPFPIRIWLDIHGV